MNAAEIARLFLGIAALVLSAGFSTLVWRISWMMRGYVDAERERARTNEELVGLVREFMETQKTANAEQRRQNDEIWTAIQVHAYRLNDLEKIHARTD